MPVSAPINHVPLSSAADLPDTLRSFQRSCNYPQTTSSVSRPTSSTLPLLALATFPRSPTRTRRSRLPALLDPNFSQRWETNFDCSLFGSRGSCQRRSVFTTLHGRWSQRVELEDYQCRDERSGDDVGLDFASSRSDYSVSLPSILPSERAALILAFDRFMIDTYRSLFLCLLDLAVHGSLTLLIKAIEEAQEFVTNALSNVRTGIQSAIGGINTGLEKTLGLIDQIPGRVVLFGLGSERELTFDAYTGSTSTFRLSIYPT